MDKILTIVIPTYNMEKYLDKCLSSLIVSDEGMTLFEVLVILDGSKDRSGEIARSYESRYPETIRVIDKENGNYGSCVNRGLKEAKGKYIKVLDADDWFNTEALEKFVIQLQQIDADLVLTDYTSVYMPDERKEEFVYGFEAGKRYDAFLMANSTFKQMQMHGMTYRVKLLRDMHYVQTEGISYTDQEWIFFPMRYVDSIVYLPLNIYQYLLGREGQTVSSSVVGSQPFKKRIFRLHRFVEFYPTIETLPNNGKKDYLLYKLQKNLIDPYTNVIRILGKVNQENNEALKEFDNEVRTKAPGLYAMMNEYTIHPLIPFKYVAYWRRTGKSCPTILIRTVKFLKSIKHKGK